MSILKEAKLEGPMFEEPEYDPRELSAAVLHLHQTAKVLFAGKYGKRVAPWRDVIRKHCAETGDSIMSAIGFYVEFAADNGSEMDQLAVVAAGVDEILGRGAARRKKA